MSVIAPARAICALALGAVAALGACKKSEPPTPATVPSAEAAPGDESIRPVYDARGPPDPLAKKLCEALHVLPEARRAECCGGKPGVVLAEPCTGSLSAALHAGALSLDAARLESCVRALDETSRGCEWVGPWSSSRLPAACVGLTKGRRKQGELCRSTLECSSGLFCRGSGPTEAGRCVPPAGRGESCGSGVDALAPFLRQDIDRARPECASGFCSHRRCLDIAPLGGECRAAAECGAARHCAGGSCAEGSFAKLGAACGGSSCEWGLQCAGGKCVQPKLSGQPCATDFECLGGCVRADGGAGACGPRCDIR